MWIASFVLFASTAFGEEPKAKLEEKPKEKTGPLFTISKETTYITEPLRKNGYPDYAAGLDKRLSQGVTPENNSLVAILKIIGPSEVSEQLRPQLYRKLGIEPLPAAGAYLTGSATFGKKEEQEAFYKQQERAMDGPWSDDEAPLIAKWIAANEQALAALPAAVARTKYYMPILMEKDDDILIAALLPLLSPMRDLARVVTVRGMRSVKTGAIDKAQADAITLHRLARQTAEGGFLIDYLVGIAIESMATKLDAAIAHHGKLTAAQAKAFATELAKLPVIGRVAEKYDVERFMFLDAVTVISREGPGGLEMLTNMSKELKVPDPLMQSMFRNAIDWDTVLKLGNGSYDQLVTAAKIADWKERKSAVGKVMKDVLERQEKQAKDPIDWIAAALDSKVRARKAGSFIGNVLIQLLLPALDAVIVAEEREIVKRELVQVSLAMAAYRAENGKYPEKLEALAPKYLAKLPLDPWSGKSYIFRTEKAGYVLYGVGQNEKDDGGKEDSRDDYMLTVK